MHSWQNGTRCRDGVKLLWCHSYLVWLVLEGSIPTCTCFQLENFFVTCSCFFCLFLFFRGRCMISNIRKYRSLLFTKNKVSS